MKNLSRILLSLAVAGALIGLLLYWSGVDAAEIIDKTAALESRVFWQSTAILALIYVLRALRFRSLITGRSPSLRQLLPVSASHGLAAYVLPAKVGEASLVLYLRAACGLSPMNGTAVLVVARILDLASVAGGLGIVCLLLGMGGAYPKLVWLLPMGGLLVAATVLLAWLSVRSDRLIALATGLLRLLHLDRTALGMRLSKLALQLASALREVRGMQLIGGALYSPPIWFCVFLYYAVLARGFGVDKDFGEAVFASSLAVLANLLPVNGFAGFGTQDTGWVVGYTSLGVGKALATTSGVAFHLVYLFHIVLFGVLGHAAMASEAMRSLDGPLLDSEEGAEESAVVAAESSGESQSPEQAEDAD